MQVELCGWAPVGRMPLVVKARSSGLEDQEVLSVKGTGNASQQVAQGHRERAESSHGKVAGHHQRVPESRGGPGQARDPRIEKGFQVKFKERRTVWILVKNSVWTEEPGRLSPRCHKTVRHDLVTK